MLFIMYAYSHYSSTPTMIITYIMSLHTWNKEEIVPVCIEWVCKYPVRNFVFKYACLKLASVAAEGELSRQASVTAEWQLSRQPSVTADVRQIKAYTQSYTWTHAHMQHPWLASVGSAKSTGWCNCWGIATSSGRCKCCGTAESSGRCKCWGTANKSLHTSDTHEHMHTRDWPCQCNCQLSQPASVTPEGQLSRLGGVTAEGQLSRLAGVAAEGQLSQPARGTTKSTKRCNCWGAANWSLHTVIHMNTPSQYTHTNVQGCGLGGNTHTPPPPWFYYTSKPMLSYKRRQ